MSDFQKEIYQLRYSHTRGDGTKETWDEIAHRVVTNVLSAVDVSKDTKDQLIQYVKELKFIPGGRYLYASGRPYKQTQNCFLFRAQDSREGWADLTQKSMMCLMTGGGVGSDYSLIRAEGKPIRKTGGFATGPISLAQIVNECGRYVKQGGQRRSAIWGGLNWQHEDIIKWIHTKDWSPEVRKLKEDNFSFPATLDMTNISVLLDDEFFEAYNDETHPKHSQAYNVYWETVRQMLKKSEPGFSVDVGKNRGETLRNACTEISSKDDSDVCNLGSINLARIESAEEMKDVTELGTLFLLAGTLYSDVHFALIDQVRTKNRRLGLGLMGLHEFLLKRGKSYAPDKELEGYLKIYSGNKRYSNAWADRWEISRPVKARAVAPVGTIGIVAGTTTGIEPLFCPSFKRRYLKGKDWHYQYVINDVAQKLVDECGIDPDTIEDAYSLAEKPEKRLAFQAWVQEFVDHCISSTMNLPAWGTELNNENTVHSFGEHFLTYLPKLRGLTVYADGSRGGQPLVPVKYNTARKHLGEVFVEGVDICDITKAGSCSS